MYAVLYYIEKCYNCSNILINQSLLYFHALLFVNALNEVHDVFFKFTKIRWGHGDYMKNDICILFCILM